MNRNLVALLVISFSIFGNDRLSAQDLTQIVRGFVLDQDSKIPLIGATVFIVGTDPILGASTDLDGRFSITGVPVGRNDLVIQYLGYEPKSIPQVDVGSGKEVVLKIEMMESTEQLQEVLISGDKKSSQPNNEMALVSTRSFSLERSLLFAGSMNDP